MRAPLLDPNVGFAGHLSFMMRGSCQKKRLVQETIVAVYIGVSLVLIVVGFVDLATLLS